MHGLYLARSVRKTGFFVARFGKEKKAAESLLYGAGGQNRTLSNPTFPFKIPFAA